MADHDKQLLEKLKARAGEEGARASAHVPPQAKLRAEKGPDSESHAQMLERLQKAVRETVSVPKDVLAEAKADPITSEELMMLRKELMGRVRDLEDQLASLTLKKK